MKIDFTQVITAKDQANAAALEATRTEARAYLQDTDWYVTRRIETGSIVPREVGEKRAAARVVLSD